MIVLRTLRSSSILSAFLMAMCAAAPAALAAGEALDAHHVARLRAVTQVAVSPDGKQIAYVLSVPRLLPDQEDGAAWAELHVVGATGDSRPYVVGEHNVSAIAWTPDGKSISFLAKREGEEQKSLYLEKMLRFAAATEHDLTAVISHRLPLVDGPHGYEIFAKRAENCTKVVLVP